MTTSSPSPGVLPPAPTSVEPPPLSFNVPEGFFALPLAPTPQERTERAHSFVRELYSRGDEKIWEPAAPYYAAIAELMAGTGVSYAAMGLFSTAGDEDAKGDDVAADTGEGDDGVPRHDLSGGAAQCAFTVAAVPTDQTGAQPTGTRTDIVAQGILAVLASDPHNDARWLDLPCGPAVSCITLREYKLNPEVTASGEVTDLLTGQIQVHVPFPTGPFTAVFTLHTASMDYWAEFCDLMAAVLRTVSFTDPLTNTGSDANTEDTTPNDPASPQRTNQ
ncbi:hypothetical protein [Streptomyces cavernae]|uniref:hypothetical protein n=1 Tax=Streptomyces cavernae TaxID=2259034 RepID=UPI000FEBFF7C|nr:hypothetical protein [Streptomyces cavernae]